jgi:hypothetical protein
MKNTEISSTKRSVADRAVAVRRLLKSGKSRAEILAEENLTLKEYRTAIKRLGEFPKKNADAFASYVLDCQLALERIAEDAELARAAGDYRALPSFHRIALDIRMSANALAMKLGLLERAAEQVDLNVTRSYEVSFGDENVKPVWPTQ